MSFDQKIKNTRQKELLTQEAFALELRVSPSSVIRWENGKARPSYSAMKAIKTFCSNHNVDYKELEEEWLSSSEEETE